MKRPNTPWICFVVERSQSTDFKGIAPTDKIKLIADEWKALSADEKQVPPPPPPLLRFRQDTRADNTQRFLDQATADKQRYEREISAENTV